MARYATSVEKPDHQSQEQENHYEDTDGSCVKPRATRIDGHLLSVPCVILTLIFMASAGVVLAVLSGVCNGLFTAPMKLEARWKWENTWFVFILVACVALPCVFVFSRGMEWVRIFESAPRRALFSAAVFGFAWGFGAICFGRSVASLGISVANSLVIGLSSALGSLVPLLLAGSPHIQRKELVLFAGVAAFLVGVWLCGKAGRLRESQTESSGSTQGYAFAIAAGTMSAVFNIGYALALPMAETGTQMGYSHFEATNCIWLLMLVAGSIPNLAYCWYLMSHNETSGLLLSRTSGRSWGLSIAMGLLWGGSIFLYGAATPRLGDIGPSIGWPLSLAVGLLVANLMGVLLGEWRAAGRGAVRKMRWGISTLLLAIMICAVSTRVTG